MVCICISVPHSPAAHPKERVWASRPTRMLCMCAGRTHYIWAQSIDGQKLTHLRGAGVQVSQAAGAVQGKLHTRAHTQAQWCIPVREHSRHGEGESFQFVLISRPVT